jgi:hypothetical protein
MNRPVEPGCPRAVFWLPYSCRFIQTKEFYHPKGGSQGFILKGIRGKTEKQALKKRR